MDDPFELPARIREIQVGAGRPPSSSSDCTGPSVRWTTPAAVPEGRRTAPRRRSRSASASPRVEDLLYRFPDPLRGSRPLPDHRVAAARASTASIAGEVLSCGLRPTRRPRFKIFELLVRDAHRRRSARSGSTSRFSPTSSIRTSASILFGKLELTSHGLQLQNPQYEILNASELTTTPRRGRASRTTTTLHTGRIVPVYEKTGTLTHEDAARARARRAAAAAGGRCRIRCPTDVRARAAAVDAARRCIDVALSAGRTRRSTTLNAFRDAGAAAADLRGVLPLPARACCARRHAPTPSGSRVGRRSTIASASRRARVLPFKLTGGQKTGAHGDRRRTCSGRSR